MAYSRVKFIFYILRNYRFCGGPGSSVGIATGYGLEGPGIESSLLRGAVVFGPFARGKQPTYCASGSGA
jgi:hypothetical protein